MRLERVVHVLERERELRISLLHCKDSKESVDIRDTRAKPTPQQTAKRREGSRKRERERVKTPALSVAHSNGEFLNFALEFVAIFLISSIALW